MNEQEQYEASLMSEVVLAVLEARRQTDEVESRAIKLLHERGVYTDLTGDEDRTVDALVRRVIEKEVRHD